MDTAELVRLLTPLVGMTGREQLRSLRRSPSVSLRYDHVINWDALREILEAHADEIDLFDGQEWFHLTVRGVSS